VVVNHTGPEFGQSSVNIFGDLPTFWAQAQSLFSGRNEWFVAQWRTGSRQTRLWGRESSFGTVCCRVRQSST